MEAGRTTQGRLNHQIDSCPQGYARVETAHKQQNPRRQSDLPQKQ